MSRLPRRPVRRAVALALVAGAALLAACSGSTALPSEITGAVPVDSTPVTTTAPARECTTAEKAAVADTATYPPLDPLPGPDALPAGSTMATIKARGRLVVGVSGDTLLFGARNSLTGQIEGFDIDMLKEVAKAIFGPDGGDKIEFRVITYADRLPKLEARDVDIVAHTMTINCKRWLRIAFSSVYFLAGQRVLVGKDSAYTSITDFDGTDAVVCAPNGSTNIDEMTNRHKQVQLIGKDDISDCLVAMQQGQAAGTTGDDTVLAGFAAQDPNTHVVGAQFTQEPYGLGFNRDDTQFVQFVNAVLEQVRSSGRWDEIVKTWLTDTNALQDVTPLPAPDYSRPLP